MVGGQAMDVSFTVKGSAPSSRLDTEKTKEVTALQGLVLGCLGAPRGSLEMYPEAGLKATSPTVMIL